jgi:hypothetical protein
MKPEYPSTVFTPEGTTRLFKKWYQVLRSGVSYGNLVAGDTGQNIDGYPTTITITATINTTFAVPHKLGRVPVGYHVVSKNKSVDIYNSATPWTDMNIYLEAPVTNVVVTLFIF